MASNSNEENLGFLLQDTSDASVRVHKVEIYGLKATRTSLVQSLLDPVYAASTFQETLDTLSNFCGKLEALGIVRSVDISLDKSQNYSGSQQSIDVRLDFKEIPRLTIQTGTEFGNGEGSMNGSVALKNIAGGGEQAEASVAFGNKTTSTFQFRASTPVNSNNPHSRIEAVAYQTQVNNQSHASHDLLSRGVGINYKTLSTLGIHEISYSGVWRTLHGVGFSGSSAVRDQAGDNIKSSISHSFLKDNRDEPLLPTSGTLLRISQELAGLKGDTHFAKIEGEYQKHTTPSLGYILSFGLRGGLLYPLQASGATMPCSTHIADRFLLGGPTSVRGFAIGGLGPRSSSDRLGGDIMAAAGVSLHTPLPYFTTPHLKGHIFANAGGVSLFKPETQLGKQIKQLISRPSAAIGFGLTYRHGAAVRLELNYCLPIAARAGDSIKPGIQLGLGVNFL